MIYSCGEATNICLSLSLPPLGKRLILIFLQREWFCPALKDTAFFYCKGGIPIPTLTNTYIDFTKLAWKRRELQKGTFGTQGIKENLQQIKKWSDKTSSNIKLETSHSPIPVKTGRQGSRVAPRLVWHPRSPSPVLSRWYHPPRMGCCIAKKKKSRLKMKMCSCPELFVKWYGTSITLNYRPTKMNCFQHYWNPLSLTSACS